MKGRIKIDRSGKKIGIVALFKSIFPRCQRSPKQTRSKYALQWPAISNNRGDSIVQRHFTSFLGRRPLDARDPIGEFESRFGRWTRFECKPTRDCSLSLFLSLSLSLSLSLCSWQPEEWREGWGGHTGRSRWSFSFRAPWCVYSSAELVPPCCTPPPLRELARLRNFRFGLIQFSKSFDFLPDVPDFWYGVFSQQRGWEFSLSLSRWNN